MAIIDSRGCYRLVDASPCQRKWGGESLYKRLSTLHLTKIENVHKEKKRKKKTLSAPIIIIL